MDKSSPESRAKAGQDMTSKLSEKNAPQFLVFAEGQTSDGRQVLAFKDGAFRLGHTVQPVAVRYHRSTYDPTNAPENMVWHFIRATFDLHHGMDVEFLDVTSKEVDETPSDFAGRVEVVSRRVCKYLCPIIPTTTSGSRDGVGNFIKGRLPI